MSERITKFFGPYRFLSNFWPCPIVGRLDLLYMSVEAAYQAEKPPYSEEGEVWVHRISEVQDPGRAKQLGRKCPLGDHWTAEFKLIVMKGLLWQKFQQDDLRQLLLETEDRELVEGNTWGDTFWGRVGGVGDNHLGEILMQIRGELQGDR